MFADKELALPPEREVAEVPASSLSECVAALQKLTRELGAHDAKRKAKEAKQPELDPKAAVMREALSYISVVADQVVSCHKYYDHEDAIQALRRIIERADRAIKESM